MLKSAVLLFSIVLLTLTGCSPKASDSDVGRVKEADGFKVKTFLTVKLSPVDADTADLVKAKMNERGIEEREMIEINGVKRTKYYSSGYEEMVEIKQENGKTTEITLEGLKGFTDTVTDNIQNKSIINSNTLKNAKKTFAADMDEALNRAKVYLEENGLESDSSTTINSKKTEEFKNGNKRMVFTTSPDYFILIIEGSDEFVKPLRTQLNSLN